MFQICDIQRPFKGTLIRAGNEIGERVFITCAPNNNAPFMEQHLTDAASIERCEILC